MASLFGHVVASSALGATFFPRQIRGSTLLLAGFCAFAPDLDVMAFQFGISYHSVWGHRGWTHSVVFTLILGFLLAGFFYKKQPDTLKTALWCALSALSHPLLDMLTNGGLGCALWWPFSEERLFFPSRPIQVSPIGVGNFFSSWGVRVLASEALWIGLPAMMLWAAGRVMRSSS